MIWLLEHGASAMITDLDGDTPLHVCERSDIAQLLIDAGEDVSAINSEGFIPVQTAHENDHEDVVALLLPFTPDIELAKQDEDAFEIPSDDGSNDEEIR